MGDCGDCDKCERVKPSAFKNSYFCKLLQHHILFADQDDCMLFMKKEIK